MKQKFIVVVVLAVLALFSSCTLEKRHYRNGFYFNRPGGGEISRVQDEPAVAAQQTAVTPVEEAGQSNTTDALAAVTQRDSTATTDAERTRPSMEEPIHKELPVKTHAAPAPLEKDKNQAIGAGVASAIFFVLGMTGLIIKGTGGSVGVFIVAAFICCILCIMLASFLYPRDPVVKQPKEPHGGEISQAGKLGIGLLIVVFSIFLLIAALFLSIFTSLLF